MNFRPSHIPFDHLVDWVEQRLSPETQAQLQSHLATCAQCQREAAQVARLLSTMQTDTAVDPPAQVVDRVRRLFAPRIAATPTLLQRIVAVLQFDSLQLAAAPGIRAGNATPRQLLFNAGAYDLDVRLTPSSDPAQPTSWLISGQVLGSDALTGQIRLEGLADSIQVPLTTPGEFVLPPVAAGTYTLVVALSDCEFAVAPLVVGT